MYLDFELIDPYSKVRNNLSAAIDETTLDECKIVLQPIAMRVPNSHCVYSPTKLRAKKEIRYEEFLSFYALHPRGVRVCFDEFPDPATVFEKSELITAYGFGLDCWYIVVPDESKTGLFEMSE